jgi:TonB-dependent starch-binding outer membrane protein SusC
VFNNVALFNPTQPIRVTDPETGQSGFFEIGSGRQSVRNPVALTEQVQDKAVTNRTLGNVTAEFDLLSSLTAQLNLGTDRSGSVRRLYLPKASPAGAEWGGRARQVERDNSAITFQSLLTYRGRYAETHDLEVVGGYEYADYNTEEFGAEGRNFLTDAFSFNNLGGGATLVTPFSSAENSRLVSFFTRANYGLADKYFLTGVLRRDGSSRFGEGNKWALFPAVSASWRISAEPFMQNAPLSLSDLRVRVGWGLQGNPGVPPYASLQLLEPSSGVRYVFGDQVVTGVAPTRNPNPELKWEETSQTNVGIDYGFAENRFTGSLEYYVKNTSDLLLNVFVPQPAVVDTVLANVGEVRNRGVEFSLDARVIDRDRMNWTAGLIFSKENNEVVNLGGRTFISSGRVSGQGQSGQVSQRIIPGQPLGTFWGPTFVGVSADGKQEFACHPADPSTRPDCVNGRTTSAAGEDFGILGDANPDFSWGLRSNVNWGNFDGSFLLRAAHGQEVFNNTALVYQSKANVKQGNNFLRDALSDQDNINEPAKFSSRWIEDGSFVRLQNVTVGYTFNLPMLGGDGRTTRVYLSGDNLFLLTDYSGYDPEVHAEVGLASRGIDYLSYPRPRTFTGGVQLTF